MRNVGFGPRGGAVTPDGVLTYATNTAGNSVSVIDTASETVVATVEGFDGPLGVRHYAARSGQDEAVLRPY